MDNSRFRVRLWPTVGLIFGLMLLIALGTWQTQRFLVKYAEEERRDEMKTLEPLAVSSLHDLRDKELAFRQVVLKGHFENRYKFLIKHRILNNEPGFWLLSPFILADDSTTLLVNRGWIPFRNGVEIARGLSESGDTHLTGIIHQPEYVIADQQVRDALRANHELAFSTITQWDSYDITGIYDLLPFTTPEEGVVVTAATQHSGSPYPIASYEYIIEPYLTAEKHFGYALTWFTLALALIGIYIAHGLGLLHAQPYDD